MSITVTLSDDTASPSENIEILDDDWAILTVSTKDGNSVKYSVSRHGVAERIARLSRKR